MKERRSVKVAKWTKAREDWYKDDCDEILFRTRSALVIDGSKVFVKINTQTTYLLTVENLKSMWFQIWLELRKVL